MNLHSSLNQTAYAIHNDKLQKGSVETMEKIRALENISIAYKDAGKIPGDYGILEIAVSFDGAWHRRGHS